MTAEEALRKLRCLEWTEEVRPGHPWQGQILVNRREVEKLLKEATDG
jgi:hypothetical protein